MRRLARSMPTARALLLIPVLALLVAGCGPGSASPDTEAAGDSSTGPSTVPEEDTDNPTPPRPAPTLAEGCDREPSIRQTRETLTDSAFATALRSAPTPLTDVADDASGVLIGKIEDVRQGPVQDYDAAEHLPSSDNQNVQLFAHVIMTVEEIHGPVSTDLQPGDRAALPVSVSASSPPPAQFPEKGATSHTNLVNELDCILPRQRAAALVTGIGDVSEDPDPDCPAPQGHVDPQPRSDHPRGCRRRSGQP